MTSTVQAQPCTRLPLQRIVLVMGLATGFVLTGCMSIESKDATTNPTEPLKPICHVEDSTEGCWMLVEDTENCHIWIDRRPSDGETASFDEFAECPHEKLSASGTATFKWERGGNWRTHTMTGTFVQGLAQGQFRQEVPMGGIVEGSYVDNLRHGLWLTNNPVVGRTEGMYEKGHTHGD